MGDRTAARPLDGVRVIEFSSIAPAPFCAMMLADFGADVIVLERPGGNRNGIPIEGPALFSRGKRSLIADLKSEDGLAVARELAGRSDVVIEGFRPGVMERLGLGPDDLMADNPGLVYTRLTGYGQDGPYALRAGHDINYIAVAGVLGQIGYGEPVPPNNFVGDLAGGSLMAVIGTLLALHARSGTGHGQVVDAAMVDGAALLMGGVLELHRRSELRPRGENNTDGLAPFYGSYLCSDGRWFSVGAIEPKFYAALLEGLGLEDEPPGAQHDRSRWPALRARMAATFRTRTSADWDAALSPLDACVAPVRELDDLAVDPHTKARRLFEVVPGGLHPAPAPRLTRTPGVAGRYPQPGEHTAEILHELHVTGRGRSAPSSPTPSGREEHS